MSRLPLRRLIFALAVGAVLVSPGPAAAGPRAGIEHRQLPHILSLPMDVMTSLWNLFDRVLTKTGCSIDPHGVCTTGQGSTSEPPAQVDTGCGIDPHGVCGSGS